MHSVRLVNGSRTHNNNNKWKRKRSKHENTNQKKRQKCDCDPQDFPLNWQQQQQYFDVVSDLRRRSAAKFKIYCLWLLLCGGGDGDGVFPIANGPTNAKSPIHCGWCVRNWHFTHLIYELVNTIKIRNLLDCFMSSRYRSTPRSFHSIRTQIQKIHENPTTTDTSHRERKRKKWTKRRATKKREYKCKALRNGYALSFYLFLGGVWHVVVCACVCVIDCDCAMCIVLHKPQAQSVQRCYGPKGRADREKEKE